MDEKLLIKRVWRCPNCQVAVVSGLPPHGWFSVQRIRHDQRPLRLKLCCSLDCLRAQFGRVAFVHPDTLGIEWAARQPATPDGDDETPRRDTAVTSKR